MSTIGHDSRVAVLVDCDNVPTDIVEHALLMVAQFGRVVLRRGYGNHNTLANKWQEVLVRQAFTPCLQYQYASGKNTADIALALDALEALFDHRADTFCLVTSDSDFLTFAASSGSVERRSSSWASPRPRMPCATPATSSSNGTGRPKRWPHPKSRAMNCLS